MAGVTLGFLKYVLGLDTLAFRKGMTEAERDLVKLQKSFEKRGQAMIGLGKTLSIGFTAPLAAFAAKGIKEAQETAEAMGQVNAALASMGPTAGRTAEQLSKMADGLETSSLFEADEILRKVTANLLTFGNISGQAFDRAQQAAVDLATRMGTDLQSATILVGKALNDPIKGMGALGKAGIQFTASQKETIKAMVAGGNAAGAQALILKELEKQFSGSAAAAQNTDPWNKLSDAFNQMAEKVGTALLPLIPPLTDAIVSVANAFTSLSPETQKWVLIAAAATAAAGPLLIGLGSIVTVVAKIGPLVLALSNAWKIFVGVMTLARVASVALLPALVPFLIPLAAIAAAVGVAYLAWKNWDKIVAIVTRVYTAVKTYLLDKLNAVWDWIVKKLEWVGSKFKWLYDAVVGHSYIPDMVEGIADWMAKLENVMAKPAAAAASKTAEAFRQLQSDVGSLMNRLFPEAAALNSFRADLKTLEDGMKGGIVATEKYQAALERLKTEGLTDVPLDVLDQGSLAPDFGSAADQLGQIADKTDDIVASSRAWQDVVGDVAADLGQIVGDWLTAFIEGSAKLKDLWKAILAYAIKSLFSQNGPIQALAGARAAGGPVMSGKTYLVGEKGPELFSPGRSGSITSNDDMRRMGGGTSITQYITTPDANSFHRNQRQIARDTKRRLAFA